MLDQPARRDLGDDAFGRAHGTLEAPELALEDGGAPVVEEYGHHVLLAQGMLQEFQLIYQGDFNPCVLELAVEHEQAVRVKPLRVGVHHRMQIVAEHEVAAYDLRVQLGHAARLAVPDLLVKHLG